MLKKSYILNVIIDGPLGAVEANTNKQLQHKHCDNTIVYLNYHFRHI